MESQVFLSNPSPHISLLSHSYFSKNYSNSHLSLNGIPKSESPSSSDIHYQTTRTQLLPNLMVGNLHVPASSSTQVAMGREIHNFTDPEPELLSSSCLEGFELGSTKLQPECIDDYNDKDSQLELRKQSNARVNLNGVKQYVPKSPLLPP